MPQETIVVGGSRAESSNAYGMELLIPVVNKLQEVFNTTGTSSDCIQLPQIVVLGDQSSGKSSLLESLVGKPFLPRGTGIVTRCPIVLKLIHTPGVEEWCEFLHQPDQKYKNFKDVEKEIIAKTNQLVGTNRGITKEKIQLTVHSPNVVTLTLVDLPGIVKIKTRDQPDDIVSQTKELIMEYINQPNSIILAVSTANNDIATSESLRMANLVDPNKERTLAVFTKLDLGLDSSDVLTGRLFPMKLGIFGVVNRSQDDIEKNKTIQQAIKSEEIFLKSRYPEIASKHGTPNLAKQLNKVLMQHIAQSFPSLDMRIVELTSEFKSKLDELGSDIEMNEAEKMETMVEIINKFAKSYQGQIDGKGRNLKTNELSGGARVDYIFENTFEKNLNLLNPLEDVTDMEIMIAVRNSRGIGNRQFIIEDAFQELAKRQIMKMKAICVHCAKIAHQEMLNIIPKSLDSFTSQRFPRVNGKITQIVNELLQSRSEVSIEMLEHYIDVQATAATTSDTDFHREMALLVQEINTVGLGDLPVSQILQFGNADTILSMAGGQMAASDGPQSLTEEQILSCQIVKRLMESYLHQIVRKQVRDYVPKSLMHFLIYHTVDNVHTALLNRLHSVDIVEELIKEADEIAEKRHAYQMELKALNEASAILDEVKGTTQF